MPKSTKWLCEAMNVRKLCYINVCCYLITIIPIKIKNTLAQQNNKYFNLLKEIRIN